MARFSMPWIRLTYFVVSGQMGPAEHCTSDEDMEQHGVLVSVSVCES